MSGSVQLPHQDSVGCHGLHLQTPFFSSPNLWLSAAGLHSVPHPTKVLLLAAAEQMPGLTLPTTLSSNTHTRTVTPSHRNMLLWEPLNQHSTYSDLPRLYSKSQTSLLLNVPHKRFPAHRWCDRQERRMLGQGWSKIGSLNYCNTYCL